CLDDHRDGRRPKVGDESTCSFCLFADCGNTRRIDHFPLHFGGERSYDVKAWVGKDIDQEDCQVAVALCDSLDNLSRGGLCPDLCLHLLTNAQGLVNRGKLCPRSARWYRGDGLCIQHRSLEGFGCADVRFRAARPNSHREPDTSNDWCGFRGELASCSGILEHVLGHDTKIKGSARGHLDEFRRSTIADARLMPGTFLELGRNLIQCGGDAATRDNLKFSGLHLNPPLTAK